MGFVEENCTSPQLLFEARDELEGFQRKSLFASQRLLEYLTYILEENQTLGIYVPGRAINSLIKYKIPIQNSRFFDDNSRIHNTYFPGIDISIESREELIRHPTDNLLIMSHSFGDALALQLRNLLPKRVKTLTFNQLCNLPIDWQESLKEI